MKTVRYGGCKIAVDVDKTKKYYNTYKVNNSQANRNFAKYCENLPEEERAFFDEFGIDPICCEIEHICADKKGNFPCGGYYLVCGQYLEYPSEELISIEEIAENELTDELSDTQVSIGMFQFDFQCDDHIINDVPSDMPEGFICIRFWCEDMKWLLPEKPDEMMYEPAHFWEIHKIIKERINNKKQQAIYLEKTRSEFLSFFKDLNIKAELLNKKELKEYKKEWVNRFAPADSDLKKIKKLCLDSSKYTSFLWHLFSYEF